MRGSSGVEANGGFGEDAGAEDRYAVVHAWIERESWAEDKVGIDGAGGPARPAGSGRRRCTQHLANSTELCFEVRELEER